MKKVEEMIQLFEMMARNNLAAWEEGTKIKHDSYMKGKGDGFLEAVGVLKQFLHQEEPRGIKYESSND